MDSFCIDTGFEHKKVLKPGPQDVTGTAGCGSITMWDQARGKPNDDT